MIAIDASLAVKWYVVEDFSEDARALFDTHANDITVPDIFRTEVIGVLVRQANIDKAKRQASEDAIYAFLELFTDGFIQRTDLSEAQMARAATLALNLGHPLKDCLYLALAMDLDCPLVTCDVRFAVKAKAVWAGVRVLGTV